MHHHVSGVSGNEKHMKAKADMRLVLPGGLAGHFFLGPVGALCAYLPPAGVRRKQPPTGPRRGARTSKNMPKGAFGTSLGF